MAIIPKWSQHLGYMLAYEVKDGARFWLNCTGCNRERRKLILPDMVLKLNPLWSPWARRPICEICGKAMFISGAHSNKPGGVVYPLIAESFDPEWKQIEEMHRAWRQEQDRLFPIFTAREDANPLIDYTKVRKP